MSKLRIVLDGRMYKESGIGRYIRNLLEQLQNIDKENSYFILLLKSEYETLTFPNNFHKVLADFRWYGANEQIRLPGLLKSLNPDLVHFPHFNVPIFYNGKFVVTIHDLIHQHFSMERATTHGAVAIKVKRAGYKIVFKNALLRASKILVPSNFVKDQLIKNWDQDAGKVVVTKEAVDEKIITKSKISAVQCQILLKKFAIKQPYIFYVGNAHPHKNVEGLIKAFLKLREKFTNLQLVLSGSDHYFWQRIKREFPLNGIIYTGQISDEELVAIYKNAECFIMPSLEEGFGIPILEAMVFSCPVVSSNKGSLPEVGGDAAFYFDPAKPDDMSQKISKVLDDKKLRKDLTKKGLQRYKEFSWQKLAKETLEVYRQCV